MELIIVESAVALETIILLKYRLSLKQKPQICILVMIIQKQQKNKI